MFAVAVDAKDHYFKPAPLPGFSTELNFTLTLPPLATETSGISPTMYPMQALLFGMTLRIPNCKIGLIQLIGLQLIFLNLTFKFLVVFWAFTNCHSQIINTMPVSTWQMWMKKFGVPTVMEVLIHLLLPSNLQKFQKTAPRILFLAHHPEKKFLLQETLKPEVEVLITSSAKLTTLRKTNG